MNPVMYLIASTSVEMSHGKLAAQVAHAAVIAYTGSTDSMIHKWNLGGHYSKVVLGAPDLQVAERYIKDRGFRTCLIIDEGRTEIEPMTPTAVGVEIVDKDSAHVKATFGEFSLYKAPPISPQIVVVDGEVTLDEMDQIRRAADPAAAARLIAEFKRPQRRRWHFPY